MTRACLLLACLPSLLGATDASAAPATVTFSHAFRSVTVGAGELANAYCEATAVPGDSGDPAIATSIDCDLNGAVESRSLPGHKSATVVSNATFRPVSLCMSGTATFLGANGNYTVRVVAPCIEVLR